MRTLRLLALLGVVCLISSCGGSDDADSNSSKATTTTRAKDASGVGTLTIDGEANDVVLGDDVVLDSWEDQVPRDPCALEGDAISLVLRTEDEGRFIFVAEGPSATELALTLVDNHMTLALDDGSGDRHHR